MKSNNDPQLLRWLKREGANFDCASPREIRQVLKAGAKPQHIIYANPCKSHEDVSTAWKAGVRLTVVDSPEEVQKLHEAGWVGDTLIRLKVPDAGSAQPFSRKFGAPLSCVPDILSAIRSSPRIRHTGWSFHVGSLCSVPQQFSQAIELCAHADTIAGQRSAIVDIGGGFIPEPELFAAAAAEIRSAQRWFSPAATRWIGEPGRFFSSPVATLHVTVIGVKRGGNRLVTVDDSVYGTFSNIAFDGQKPTYTLLASDAGARLHVKTTLFGRTCDSADCLAEDIELPELRVGDVLEIRNMGAYTTVSASYFNGFPMPDRLYTV